VLLWTPEKDRIRIIKPCRHESRSNSYGHRTIHQWTNLSKGTCGKTCSATADFIQSHLVFCFYKVASVATACKVIIVSICYSPRPPVISVRPPAGSLQWLWLCGWAEK